MGKKYLVSVIIPIYNAERSIEKAILSVEKQTLKEVEIICIDDGSLDFSKDILRKLKKKNHNIKILEQAHAGAGKARNYGIREARGQYVAFLDADDVFLDESALEAMVDGCKKNGEVICGSFRKEIIDGEVKEVELYGNIEIDRAKGSRIKFNDFQEDFHYQSFIFSREFLLENGIFFPDYLRYQDPPFFLKALMVSESFWVEPVYLYCYTSGNMGLADNAAKIKDTLMGIRDNFWIIVQNDYKVLYDKYIDRVEYVYRNDILNFMSDDVYCLMMELIRINDAYEDKREITVIEQMYTSHRVLDDVYGSFSILEKIIDILIGGYGFKQYFADRSIQTVIVYGLGFFGDILMRVLEEANIGIVCAIDQKVDKYGKYEIIRPDDQLPECDAMIVSVKDYKAIMEKYEKKCVVISFMQIIDEI